VGRRAPAVALAAWLRAWGPLLLVLGLAAALRLWDLGGGPDPFDVDEGYTGVDALRVLAGHPALYFAANNGAEPLYVYLAALSTALLGPSAFALRLPAALAGVASVLATYLLGRTVFAAGGLALLVALLEAVSLWHLHLSRDASRVGLLPLLGTLAVWCLWRGLFPVRACSRSWTWFAGAGLCFGLALYSYLPARLLPLVGLALAGSAVLGGPGGARAAWRGLLLTAAVGALVAAPLAAYYAAHWSAFLFRVDMVSLFNPWVNEGDPWGLLGRNLLGTLGMFAVHGDPDPQYNVAAAPVFPPALAALFVVGLGLAVWRARRPAYGLWLAWFGIMLLPGVLSASSPHFARQAGIIPAVYVFPALALWAGWRWAARAWRRTVQPAVPLDAAVHEPGGPSGSAGVPPARPVLPAPEQRPRRPRSQTGAYSRLTPTLRPAVLVLGGALIAAIVGTAAFGTVTAYLGRPAAPGPSLLHRLGALPSTSGGGPVDEVYVAGSEETAEIGSYLSGLGSRPRFTQGFHSLLLPRDPAQTLYLVEREWWWRTAEQLLGARYDLEPEPSPPGLERFRVLRLVERLLPLGEPPNGPWLPLPPARWAVGARLVGYGLPAQARPGELVGVTLRWRVEAPAPDDPGQDYTFAVGLVDAAGDEVAARDWLGHPPAGWRDGDEVVSWFDLCLPPTLAPGPLQATVALYSRADFVRRPVLDGGGAPLGDQLTFGSLPVAGAPQQPPCTPRVHPALPPE
jgi:hypothetical protein